MLLKYEFTKHLTKFCVTLFSLMFVLNLAVTAYMYRDEFTAEADERREARNEMVALYNEDIEEFQRIYNLYLKEKNESEMSYRIESLPNKAYENRYIDQKGYGDTKLFNDVAVIAGANEQYHKELNDMLRDTAKRTLLLESEDGYLYRYYTKVLAAYDPMTSLELPNTEVHGWNEYFSLQTPIIFIAIALLGMLCGVFTLDSRVGMTAIQHTAKRGGLPTVWAKLGYTAIISVAVTLIMTLTPLAVFAMSTGLSDVDTPIQMLEAFTFCRDSITVGDYLAVFVAVRVLVFLAFSLAIAVIGQYTQSEVPAFVLVTALAGIGMGLTAIPAGTSYYGLRKFSVMLIANVNVMYERMYGLNIFGYCFDYTASILTVTVVICLGLILAAVFCRPRASVRARREMRARKGVFESLSLVRAEYFKHLVCNFGIFIFVAAVIVKCIISSAHYEPIVHSDENAYIRYIDNVKGEVTDEKIAYVDNEWNYIETTLASSGAMSEAYRNGEITKEEYEDYCDRRNYADYYEAACKRLVEYKDHLVAEKEKGYDVEFIYEEGIMRYLNPPLDIALILCAMFVCSAVFAMEHESGFVQILRLTSKGRKKMFSVKMCVVFTLAAVVSLLFAAVDTAFMLSRFGVDYWSADIHSIPFLSELTFGVSIGMYTILYRLVSLIGCVLVFVIVTSLSDIMKSRLKAIIAAAGIIFIPFMLGTYDVDVLHAVSIADFMAPSNIVYAASTAVVITAAAIAMLTVSRRRWIGKGEKK